MHGLQLTSLKTLMKMTTVAYFLTFIYCCAYIFNSHFLLFHLLLFNTAVCPDPGEPSKGKRLNDDFQEGKTVTFECNRNHDLVGNDTIRCEGGVWSGGLPKCKGDNNYTPLF